MKYMKVVLNMAISPNGLIARENGDEDWLPGELRFRIYKRNIIALMTIIREKEYMNGHINSGTVRAFGA